MLTRLGTRFKRFQVAIQFQTMTELSVKEMNNLELEVSKTCDAKKASAEESRERFVRELTQSSQQVGKDAESELTSNRRFIFNLVSFKIFNTEEII